MKQSLLLFLSLSAALLFSGCEKAFMHQTEPTATRTFDYLWHIVDQQYSMFDVKNVDWNTVYDTLRPQVRDGMSSDSLFTLCASMLGTLRDGHVNLYGPHDVSHDDTVYYRDLRAGSVLRNNIPVGFFVKNALRLWSRYLAIFFSGKGRYNFPLLVNRLLAVAKSHSKCIIMGIKN